MLVVTSRFDYRLLEAAQDLGASNWQRFWLIELPLLKPGVVSSGLFGFLLSFNELPRSIFLRSGQQTLPIYLWAESASHVSSIPLIYALSTIVAAISIFLTVTALRLLVFGGRKSV
jgi:ABC-type spermidine/putrescine transport system permease subunit II